MKRTYLFTWLIAFAVLFTACDKDNELEPNPTNPTLYTTYEEFIGTWNVLEVRKYGDSKFTLVDNKYTNTIVFMETEINTVIRWNQNDNVENENVTVFGVDYFQVINRLITGYYPNNAIPYFEVISVDNTKVVTIKNNTTNTTYKMIKQNK